MKPWESVREYTKMVVLTRDEKNRPAYIEFEYNEYKADGRIVTGSEDFTSERLKTLKWYGVWTPTNNLNQSGRRIHKILEYMCCKSARDARIIANIKYPNLKIKTGRDNYGKGKQANITANSSPSPKVTKAERMDMRLIPTFVDGNFHGYDTLKEILQLRTMGYEVACKAQAAEQADHMLYCHYDLNDDGSIKTVWLYSGISMTDKEFERIANLKHAFIGAIHKLK